MNQNRDHQADHLTINFHSSDELTDVGHGVLSHYVEMYWTSVLGPTSILLLRRVAHERMRRDSATFSIAGTTLARGIGVGFNSGATSTWQRTLHRLISFRQLHIEHNGLLRFPSHLPSLHDGQVARLPEELIERHHRDHDQRVCS